MQKVTTATNEPRSTSQPAALSTEASATAVSSSTLAERLESKLLPLDLSLRSILDTCGSIPYTERTGKPIECSMLSVHLHVLGLVEQGLPPNTTTQTEIQNRYVIHIALSSTMHLCVQHLACKPNHRLPVGTLNHWWHQFLVSGVSASAGFQYQCCPALIRSDPLGCERMQTTRCQTAWTSASRLLPLRAVCLATGGSIKAWSMPLV
jgi:hypothetical protein